MRNIFIVSIVAFGVILSGCSGSSSDEGEKTIKLAHTGSKDHQYNLGSEKFKEVLEDNTDVEFNVDIKADASMGSEGEAVEQVSSGSLEMTTVAAESNLADTIPEMNVFGIPYIFEDKEHVYNALDGEAGEELLDLAEDQGMEGLGYWEVGFRHITNDAKEVKGPEDMKNMKIRVQPAAVWEEHMKALGATPEPVDFDELYSALDQGVVDGEENPLPTINSMKLYEVQDYVSLTEHSYTPAVVLVNQDFYEDLTDEEAEAIQDAVDEAKEYQREELDKQEDEILEKLDDEGITVTNPDREAFAEATKNVKDAVADEVPDEIIEKMEDAK